MRRVKKTTNQQFDLLKAEMAVRPAAARGYGVGAQRAIVNAEWKDIVDKLNALGPPERTMTEWKKVWSDVRLRIKKQNMGVIRKMKKKKPNSETSYSYNKKGKNKLNENQNQVLITDDNVEQILVSVQQQLDQQNKLMNKLLKASSSITLLMERYMQAAEKKTLIMQRQFGYNEYHNLLLRRQ